MKVRLNYFEFLFVGVSIFILSFLLFSGVFNESLIYDERLHVEAGEKFLKAKDFRAEPFNPPFARELVAIPLLLNSNLKNDPIYFWQRSFVVFLTVVLGLIIYFFTKKIYGQKAASLALLLFILEPEIIAHGHYATTDLILTFFIFASFIMFLYCLEKFSLKRFFIFCVLTGLAFAVKVSAIPFLILPFMSIILYKKLNVKNKRSIMLLFLFLFTVSITIWSTYFFKFEPLLGYRYDENRKALTLSKNNVLINFALKKPLPLGSYFSTLKQIALYNYSSLYPKNSFLNGQISENGFIYFFPFAFLVKTPLILLVLFALSFFLLGKSNKYNFYLLSAIGFILVSPIFSRLNLGIRYLLPVYPFLIVFSSQIVNLKVGSKLIYGFFGTLFFMHLILLFIVYPNYISYFNGLTGNPRNGYRYLVDSNFDWGQGLIALKKYQDKNNVNDMQLAYFGTVNPSNYGVRYARIKDASLGDNKKTVLLQNDKTIAISASCYIFCGYYKNNIVKDRRIKEVIGGSILILE